MKNQSTQHRKVFCPSSIKITLLLAAFLLGAGSCAILTFFIPHWLVASLLSVGLILFLWRKLRFLGLLVFFLSLGLAWGSYRLHAIVQAQLPDQLEGTELALTVTIDSMPVYSSESVRFTAKILSASHIDHRDVKELEGQRIRLSWFIKTAQPDDSQHDVNNKHLMQNLIPGQRLGFHARLKAPRGLVNPGGFDYQAWLLSQNLIASGYVRSFPEPVLLESSASFSLERLRHRLKNRLFAEQKRHEYTGFLLALMLGDKSLITSHQWQVLQQTGTVHLMAISGLHIALVATGVYFLVRSILALLTLVGLGKGSVILPSLSAMIVVFIYSGLAGFSLPTQRALIVVVLVNIALLFHWRVAPILLLALAAVLISMIDPFLFLHASFWLSFGAVFFLIYSFSGRGPQRRWQQFCSAQWSMLVGLSLPMALFSLPLSLLAPVANLIAIPFVSLLILPIVLLSAALSSVSIELADTLLLLSHFIFSQLWLYLTWLASVDGIVWLSPSRSPWMIALALSGSLLLLAPRGLALRPVGFMLMFVFIANSLSATEKTKNHYQMTILDVGQGLALLFSTPDMHWLYDTGAKISDNFDMGSRVILPYLRYRGVSNIDTLVVSHSDNDHSGGVQGIVTSMPVTQTFAGQPEKLALSLSAEPCRAGQQWQAGAATIEVLWPKQDERLSDNDRSCVLLITLGNTRVLVPGDISSVVEQQLLKLPQLQHGIDTLIAPHHGSISSSSVAFVEQLAPRYVIYSHGYKNRYGHPHQKVKARYDAIGAVAFSTAQDGAVSIKWDAKGNELERYAERRSRPRLWYRD